MRVNIRHAHLLVQFVSLEQPLVSVVVVLLAYVGYVEIRYHLMSWCYLLVRNRAIEGLTTHVASILHLKMLGNQVQKLM